VQRPFLFELTVRENLTIGLENVEPATLQRAIEFANVETDISRLEAGLDTAVGWQGRFVSVAVAQRIILARTVLRNLPIVLLDEATSAQASHVASAIGKKCRSLSWIPRNHPLITSWEERCTVVATTHALEMIRNWDMALVMGSDGSVVEFGSQKQLLQERGKFWYMINQVEGIHMDAFGQATIKPERLLNLWAFCSAPSATLLTSLANGLASQTVAGGEVIYHAHSQQDRFILLAQGQVTATKIPELLCAARFLRGGHYRYDSRSK
jgi:ABC-type thiamine transport system ATPase subunit